MAIGSEFNIPGEWRPLRLGPTRIAGHPGLSDFAGLLDRATAIMALAERGQITDQRPWEICERFRQEHAEPVKQRLRGLTRDLGCDVEAFAKEGVRWVERLERWLEAGLSRKPADWGEFRATSEALEVLHITYESTLNRIAKAHDTENRRASHESFSTRRMEQEAGHSVHPDAIPSEVPTITLSQIAKKIGMTKEAVKKVFQGEGAPQPCIRGVDGRAHHYVWNEVREFVSKVWKKDIDAPPSKKTTNPAIKTGVKRGKPEETRS